MASSDAWSSAGEDDWGGTSGPETFADEAPWLAFSADGLADEFELIDGTEIDSDEFVSKDELPSSWNDAALPLRRLPARVREELLRRANKSDAAADEGLVRGLSLAEDGGWEVVYDEEDECKEE
jgi:hypothetical protein